MGLGLTLLLAILAHVFNHCTEGQIVPGDTTGLALAPFPDFTNSSALCYFNVSDRFEEFCTKVFERYPATTTFFHSRFVTNSSTSAPLDPFVFKSRKVLWANAQSVALGFQYQSIALATNPSNGTSSVLGGATFITPGFSENTTVNDSWISDAILFLQVDRLIDFSPPYSSYTSDLLTFVAKTFDTAAYNQFKEKWTTTITSLTITGPPQYTSILGKVLLTGPAGNQFEKNRIKQDAIFGALNALIDPDFKKVWPVINILQPEIDENGQAALLQTDVPQPPTKLKLLFWLQKPNASAPYDVLSRLISHPNFTAVVSAVGFDPNVTLLYIADKFPHYDEDSSVALSPSPAPAPALVPAPEPTPELVSVPVSVSAPAFGPAPIPARGPWLGSTGGSSFTSPGPSMSSAGLAGGRIAGIAIGAGAILALLLAVALVLYRRHRSRKDAINSEKDVIQMRIVDSRSQDPGHGQHGNSSSGNETLGSSGYSSPDIPPEATALGVGSSNDSKGSSKSGARKPILKAVEGVLPEEDDISQFSDLIIPRSQLDLPLNHHGMMRVIGTGGFGQVCLGKYAGDSVAVKIVWNQTKEQRRAFLKEAAALKACRSPYVILLLGVVTFSEADHSSVVGSRSSECPSMMLVMEYMQRHDVWRHLHDGSHKEDFMWYKRGRAIAFHVTKGIVYLHSKNLVHMDIKTQNILLSQGYQAKLADFGLAKLYRAESAGEDGHQPMSTVQHFTWQYSAPEVLSGTRGTVTEKADIYSLGVVIWELCTGECPFKGMSYINFLHDPLELRDIRVPEEGPEALADLIRRCLSADPSQRPTALEASEIVLACASQKPTV